MQRHQQRTPTYALYLDVKKAFDTVWRDGLWYKLWHKGVQGKLWRLLQNMYAKTRSAVLVNGRPSAEFPVSQGTAQGCTLSPTLFDVFVDDLLESVQASGLGVEFAGSLLAALMFADDFIGLEGDPARLQALTDIAYNFCKKWRLAANVGKSAIVVYGSDSQSPVPIQQWKWGEAVIPVLDYYKYLGILLHSSCKWNVHIQSVIVKAKHALFKFSKYLKYPRLPFDLKLLMYKTYVRPTLEYGSEIWEGTKTLTNRLEAVQLRAAKMILGCATHTANVAVLNELGLETLSDRRAIHKMRWLQKLHDMVQDRLPRQWYEQHQSGQTSHWYKSMAAAWAKAGGPTPITHLWEQQGQNAIHAHAKAAVAEAAQQRAGHERQCRTTLCYYEDGNTAGNIGGRRQLQRYLGGRLPTTAIQLKLKCRTGTLPTDAFCVRRSMHGVQSPSCKLCHHECEDLPHILLQCPEYADVRSDFYGQLSACFATEQEFLAFKALPNEQHISALLSDDYWFQIGQFEVANAAVLQYLLRVWQHRMSRLEVASAES